MYVYIYPLFSLLGARNNIIISYTIYVYEAREVRDTYLRMEIILGELALYNVIHRNNSSTDVNACGAAKFRLHFARTL